MQYEMPASLDDALALRADAPWQILAGGTDIYPAHVGTRLHGKVLDISALGELAGIERTAAGWRIGALATWTYVLRADLPRAFRALKLVARELGSRQIQNAATVAGNLCNASPAADGVPALLVLDARVQLSSTSGTRELPLEEFILGNRQTALRADEIMTAIVIPAERADAPSSFVKLGARTYLVISIAMAAAQVELGADGRIGTARVAVGSCAEAARRLRTLEARLRGLPATADLDAAVRPEHLAEISPIDDVRGSATYRRVAAAEIVRRALRACLDGPA